MLRRFKIGPRIFAVIALLALASIVISAVAVGALQNYTAKTEEMERLSRGAVIGERVNAAILSAVMDSRGVYMARDRQEVDRFGNPLLATLRQLEQLLGQWREVTSSADMERFAAVDRAARQFIQFRTELVRIGREQGNPTAREFGDNDANRTVRQALNRAIEALAGENARAVTAIEADLASYGASIVWIIVAVSALSILVALVAAFLIVTRTITRPLSGTTRAISALAAGDTNVSVDAADRQDEVGDIARAVAVFRDNLIRTRELEAKDAAERKRREERAATIERFTDTFNRESSDALAAVGSATDQLKATATSMNQTAEETTRQANAVAAGSQEASTNVQTVAAASEELTASIVEISRQVTNSAQMAGRAVEEAARTNERIQGLAQAAQKIGDVVKLINDIAGQTNLLALNATIEAARAGEAGKGFAVVASEVKSLATQTGRATEEIASQIAAVQNATREAVDAIQGITATIQDINGVTTSIASAVEEQGAATQEIARNIQQAAGGTNMVSTNIAGVSSAAGATSGAAGEVMSATQSLARQADALKGQVERFIAAVRAA